MRLNVYVIIRVEYLPPQIAAVLFKLVYDDSSAVVSALVSGISLDWCLRITLSILP